MPKDYAEMLLKETLDGEDIESLMKCAIAEEDIELLTSFIEMGVDLNRNINEYGSPCVDSYLTVAIREGKIKVAKLLIDKGIAFEKPGDIAYTDIIYAGQCEQIDIFKYLVEKGADVNAEEMRGEKVDVLTFVKNYHQKEMMQYLVTKKELFSEEKQKELEKLRLRLLLYR